MEVKEVIEFLGLKPDEIKTVDDLKAKFEPEFVRISTLTEDSEIIKPFTSKSFGILETESRKLAKKFEIDIDTDIPEFKTVKKATEKYDLVAAKIIEKKDAKIAELAANAGKGNDEKVNELTATLEKEKKARKDEKELLKSISKEFDDYKATAANQLKTIKLETLKAAAKSTVKIIPEATELQKEGYDSIINKRFKFDLDETGNKLVVYDADGKLIPNPKVTGTFKSAEDVLLEIAVKENLCKLNPDGGKPKPEDTKKFSGKEDDKPLRSVAKRMNV